jgi:hypothetical protein
MRENLNPGDLITQRSMPIGKIAVASSLAKMLGIRSIVDTVFPLRKADDVSLGVYVELMFVNAFAGSVPQEKLCDEIAKTPAFVKILGELPIEKLTWQHFSTALSLIGQDKEKLADIVKAICLHAYHLTFTDVASTFYLDLSNFKTHFFEPNPLPLAHHGHGNEKLYGPRTIAISHLVEGRRGMGLYCSVNQRDMRDSKIVMDEIDNILDVVLTAGGDIVTIGFDKRVKSIELINKLDEQGIDFVTPLEIDVARELLDLSVSQMEVLDTDKNKRLKSIGKSKMRTLGRRESIEYAGRFRTAVVIFSPAVKIRHDARLDHYITETEAYLLECQTKVNNGEESWTNANEVRAKIEGYLNNRNLPAGIYNYSIEEKNGLKFSFYKDINKINETKKYHGITTLIASSTVATPSQIADIYDGRHIVEFGFKDFKSIKNIPDHPIFDSLTPIIKVSGIIKMLAVTGYRLFEKLLEDIGLNITYNAAFEELKNLHCVRQVRVDGHCRKFSILTYDTPNTTIVRIFYALNLRIENAILLFLDEKTPAEYGIRNLL